MESKKHFKMYKKGKQWIVASIVTVGVLAGGQVVHADTTNDDSYETSQSVNTSVNNNSVSMESKDSTADSLTSTASEYSAEDNQTSTEISAVSQASVKADG